MKVLTAAESAPVVTERFPRVSGLLYPPWRLIRPRILRRDDLFLAWAATAARCPASAGMASMHTRDARHPAGVDRACCRLAVDRRALCGRTVMRTLCPSPVTVCGVPDINSVTVHRRNQWPTGNRSSRPSIWRITGT